MRALDAAIALVIVAWVGMFIASLTVDALRLDPSANLVLMGLAGALLGVRRSTEVDR